MLALLLLCSLVNARNTPPPTDYSQLYHQKLADKSPFYTPASHIMKPDGYFDSSSMIRHMYTSYIYYHQPHIETEMFCSVQIIAKHDNISTLSSCGVSDYDVASNWIYADCDWALSAKLHERVKVYNALILAAYDAIHTSCKGRYVFTYPGVLFVDGKEQMSYRSQTLALILFAVLIMVVLAALWPPKGRVVGANTQLKSANKQIGGTTSKQANTHPNAKPNPKLVEQLLNEDKMKTVSPLNPNAKQYIPRKKYRYYSYNKQSAVQSPSWRSFKNDLSGGSKC